MTQHLLGLLTAVVLYVLLRRWGLASWLATLATLPLLFDAMQLVLEHSVLSDVLFGLLLVLAVAALAWSPTTADGGGRARRAAAGGRHAGPRRRRAHRAGRGRCSACWRGRPGAPASSTRSSWWSRSRRRWRRTPRWYHHVARAPGRSPRPAGARSTCAPPPSSTAARSRCPPTSGRSARPSRSASARTPPATAGTTRRRCTRSTCRRGSRRRRRCPTSPTGRSRRSPLAYARVVARDALLGFAPTRADHYEYDTAFKWSFFHYVDYVATRGPAPAFAAHGGELPRRGTPLPTSRRVRPSWSTCPGRSAGPARAGARRAGRAPGTGRPSPVRWRCCCSR